MYYRLRQRDNDGREKLSAVISVNGKNSGRGNSFALSPNPFNKSLLITSEVPGTIINLELTDLEGRVITPLISKPAEIGVSGFAPESEKLHSVPAGMYIIRVYTAEGVWNLKAVKEQ